MNWSNKVFRKNFECLVGCVKIGIVGVIWILKNFKKEKNRKRDRSTVAHWYAICFELRSKAWSGVQISARENFP